MVKEKVSLIIPAYNEEEGLSKVIKEIPAGAVDEIVVVDDGSTDGTHEVAENLGVKVIRHMENRGKVAAIFTGIQNATGDIIALTDADFTYPARYIPVILEQLQKGYDLAIGSRFSGDITNMPPLNKIGNRFLSLVATYVSGTKITDAQSGFRAFRRDFLDRLGIAAKSLEFETEMTVKAAKLGYKVKEIPIEYRKRIGKSKLNPIKDGYRMFTAILSILYKETSMLTKAILFPGLASLLIGTFFGIVSLKEYMTFGRPLHVYYPTLTVLFMLLGVQLFSMGLIMDNMTKKLDRVHEILSRRY